MLDTRDSVQFSRDIQTQSVTMAVDIPSKLKLKESRGGYIYIKVYIKHTLNQNGNRRYSHYMMIRGQSIKKLQ